jgi:hypothetical protein
MKLLVKQPESKMKLLNRIFNFISGINKILFSTMDSKDATYYTEKIWDLQKDQTNYLTL